MKISFVYASEISPLWLDLEMDENATVETAIEKSGVFNQFPHLNQSNVKLGIFGKFAKRETKLQPGDRVEIYIPIIRQLDDDDD